ncbi:hypothetical protein GGR57DRAFT_418438 [Xylariaceae sp. FL1272]|nr:hypothetical protein GGR57DRAFT_418438 [Xylariaceae sp. FL1272]
MHGCEFAELTGGSGGTNLRVGFIELLGNDGASTQNGSSENEKLSSHRTCSNLRRVLEQSWSISEDLKNEKPDSLFSWVGRCIAEVVRKGSKTFGLDQHSELLMGVTFSFPIEQDDLARASIMSMGKGFAITSNVDLNTHLINGYELWRTPDLPPIRINAILNDAVATLVSFIYQFQEDDSHRAAMGLICGTGTNATIPLRKSLIKPSKLPRKIQLGTDVPVSDLKITCNTEWSINGTAEILRKSGLISEWDTKLDASGEVPGFQPFEYMTSGRYLGELARLIFVDYLSQLGTPEESIPLGLLHRFGLGTTFLSHYQPPDPTALVRKLEVQFPPNTCQMPVEWTEHSAVVLYHIAKSIQVRASAMMAAAVIGLLACADDIPLGEPLEDKTNRKQTKGRSKPLNLIVGYTGGCIVHFQDYLFDCQSFLDGIITAEFGPDAPVRVTLSPCHDGGLTGAGVLCGAVHAKSRDA